MYDLVLLDRRGHPGRMGIYSIVSGGVVCFFGEWASLQQFANSQVAWREATLFIYGSLCAGEIRAHVIKHSPPDCAASRWGPLSSPWAWTRATR